MTSIVQLSCRNAQLEQCMHTALKQLTSTPSTRSHDAPLQQMKHF